MPTYPVTIDAVNLPPLPNGQGWNEGPFLNGANLYVIVQDGAGPFNKAVAYKSTDLGLTWTPQNVAGEINLGLGGFLSCVQSGTKINVVVASTVGTNNVRLVFFDMATDLWTNVTAAGSFTNSNVSGAIGNYREITFRGCNFSIRSDNSFVTPFIGTEVVGGPTFARTRFDVWTGAVWSVAETMCGENGLANNDFCVGVTIGSGDRTHVFYIEYNTKTLRHRCIKSDNSVVAAAQVATGIFDPGGINQFSLGESIGRIAFNSATGEIAIPYKDTAGHLHVVTGISADSPVWTDTTVDVTKVLYKNPAGIAGEMVSAAFYTSLGLNVYFFETGGVNLYSVSRPAAVWSAPTLKAALTLPFGDIGQGIGTNDFTDSALRLLLEDTSFSSAAYFTAAAGPGPGPASSPPALLYIDQNGSQVIGLPWPMWCCTLCDQMEKSGLPRAFIGSKMVYGRSNS
jgi:hypothetical protein